MGISRTRAPVAWATALAMAPAVGIVGGSPSPIMPTLFPAFARSNISTSMSGMSFDPAMR